MSARVEHQPAFVLHRRPYRETSWLLDVFTPAHGRVSLVAKGARRGRSQDAALYQPFQPLLISWIGRSNLKTLTSIEYRRSETDTLAAGVSEMTGERLFSGFYLNELLQILLVEQDPARLLFLHYEATLRALRQSDPLEVTLRRFEKILLEELGVGVSYGQDAESGEDVEAESSYLYLPQTGFVRVDSNPEVPYDVRSAPLVLPGSALLAIAREDFGSEATLRYAKRVMRRCIDDLLHGRELRSRELIRQFKETQRV